MAVGDDALKRPEGLPLSWNRPKSIPCRLLVRSRPKVAQNPKYLHNFSLADAAAPLRHQLINPVQARVVKLIAGSWAVAQCYRFQSREHVFEVVAADLLHGVTIESAL